MPQSQMDLDSISEISATMLLVGVSIFAYLELKEGRRWKIYLSAVFLGLSLKRLNAVHFPLCRSRRFSINGQPDAADGHVQFHRRFKTGYDF